MAGSKGVKLKKAKTKSEIAYAAVEALSPTEKERLVGSLLSVESKRDLSSRYWDKDMREILGLNIPVVVFAQDPLVAKTHPKLGLQDVELDWEPGLMSGPTSARIAVVDYDADVNAVTEPARWDEKAWAFMDPEGQPIGRADTESFQFHQVSAWPAVGVPSRREHQM